MWLHQISTTVNRIGLQLSMARVLGTGASLICLFAAGLETADAQIRLNLSGGKSGIAVGPGGSGVIGQFNGSGRFQGIGIGRAGTVQVYPGRSGNNTGIRIGSGRNGSIAIGSGGYGGVSVGSGGSVGVVVGGPTRFNPPPPKTCAVHKCPPAFTQPPHYGGPVSGDSPQIEVSPGRVVVDTYSDPHSGVIRIQTLMRSGRLDEACDVAASLVEQHPDNAAVLHAYSITRFARHEFDDAAASGYDALSIDAEWSWSDARQYFTTHEAYLAPLKKLQTAAQTSPDSASLQFLLSSHYVMLDAVEQARKSIDQTSQLMPDDTVVASLQNQLPPTLN